MRLFTNILSDDLPASKNFYQELLNLQSKYDSEWFILLCSPKDQNIELGLIQRDHELVPEKFKQPANGMYLTFVVEDLAAAYQRALNMRLEIIQEPQDEFYGQRRFLTVDPNGCLVDISSPWNTEG